MADYVITLNENEVNLVVGALGEMPARASMGLILKIQDQVQMQVKSRQQITKVNEPLPEYLPEVE